MAEVPFADDGRGVAGVLEALRQEKLVGVQPVAGGSGNDDGLESVAERIASGHQGGARGRAHRLRVELLELHALLRQLVEVGRLDVGAAVEADVFPAEIVGDDIDDVGLLGLRLRRAAAGQRRRGGQGRQAVLDEVASGHDYFCARSAQNRNSTGAAGAERRFRFIGLERHDDFHPEQVALGRVVAVRLRQPGTVHDERVRADGMDVGNGRADAVGFEHESAELRAGAAVAGDLLHVKRRGARAGQAAEQRQVLRHRAVHVEQVAGLVIRILIFRVEIQRRVNRRFGADCFAHPARGQHRLKRPVTQAGVGQLVLVVTARRHPEVEQPVDGKIAVRPSGHDRQQFNVADARCRVLPRAGKLHIVNVKGRVGFHRHPGVGHQDAGRQPAAQEIKRIGINARRHLPLHVDSRAQGFNFAEGQFLGRANVALL